jgi:hypothetical protein
LQANHCSVFGGRRGRTGEIRRETVAAPGSLPILNHAKEHAIKLGLTVSVATDWADPIITGQAMKWATKLAWLSTSTMIQKTCDRIADNPREADLKRILGHIKKKMASPKER